MSTDTLFSRPKHFTPVCQQTHFSQDPNTLHQYANQVVDTAAPVQCRVWIGVQAKTYTRSRKKAKSKAQVPGTNTKWRPKGHGWLVYNNHVTFMLVVHMPGAFYLCCFVKTAFLHKPQNRTDTYWGGLVLQPLKTKQNLTTGLQNQDRGSRWDKQAKK